MQTIPELGNPVGQYASSKTRLIVWLVGGALTALLGVFLFVREPAVGFFVIPLGFLIALYGLFRNPIWGGATIFEHGVIIKQWGQTRAFRFDELDRFTVVYRGKIEGGDVGMASASILNRGRDKPQRYVFFSGDTRALVLGPSFTGWDTLGERLSSQIRQRTVEEIRAKWANGENFVIDYLRPATMKNIFQPPFMKLDTMRITLSAQGIQKDDHALLEWKNIETLPIEFDSNQVSFFARGLQGISFLRLSSPNGLVIEDFIREQIAAHKGQSVAS